jgi:hypothetical protein
MTRRSDLTIVQAQQRAASRMTPGTRMWSEQPFPHKRERWLLTTPPEEAPDQLFPPQTLEYIKIEEYAPQTYYCSLSAGQQAVFVLASSAGGIQGSAPQVMTVGAGWKILDQQSYGYQTTIVVTRTATKNENTMVVSTGPKTLSWNGLSMAGFRITPGPEKQQYAITLQAKWQTIDNGFTIHQWGGPFNSYRLRCLTARGLYASWSPGYNGDESGHYASQMGYITPESCFYTPYGPPSNVVPYLTNPWVTGYWRHRSIGAVGPCHWTEHHIQLVPK